jgi:hypothetical protein
MARLVQARGAWRRRACTPPAASGSVAPHTQAASQLGARVHFIQLDEPGPLLPAGAAGAADLPGTAGGAAAPREDDDCVAMRDDAGGLACSSQQGGMSAGAGGGKGHGGEFAESIAALPGISFTQITAGA